MIHLLSSQILIMVTAALVGSMANAMYTDSLSSSTVVPAHPATQSLPDSLSLAGLAVEVDGEIYCVMNPSSANAEAMAEIADDYETTVDMENPIADAPSCLDTNLSDLGEASVSGFYQDVQVAAAPAIAGAALSGIIIASASCAVGVGGGIIIRTASYIGENPTTAAEYFWSLDTGYVAGSFAAPMIMFRAKPVETALVVVPAFLCAKLGTKLVDGIIYVKDVKIIPLFNKLKNTTFPGSVDYFRERMRNR